MIIQNLTQENVEELQSVLSDMQQVNPDIIFRVFEKNTGTPPDAFLMKQSNDIDMNRKSIERAFDEWFSDYTKSHE